VGRGISSSVSYGATGAPRSDDSLTNRAGQGVGTVAAAVGGYALRYFSSTQGRFTSPDPFGPWAMSEPEKAAFFSSHQQWNRYSYVTNNPLKYTDPTGLER
jgi:RHS repeat-associated protein